MDTALIREDVDISELLSNSTLRYHGNKMLRREDFVTEVQQKFLKVLETASQYRSVTDIEIRQGELVRMGVLKQYFAPEDLITIKFRSMEDIHDILSLIMPDSQQDEHGILKNPSACFSFSVGDLGHYRTTVLVDRIGVSITLRKLSYVIPEPEVIGLPVMIPNTVIKYLGYRLDSHGKPIPTSGSRGGLLVVSGPMGSGKTTTIASLIRFVADRIATKIMTLEDPVEYVHVRSTKAVVQQIEIGSSMSSFQEGIYYALRSNVAVLHFGEIRTAEDLKAALWAAMTGMLVLASYHASSAVNAIQRMAAELEDHEIKALAASLVGVVNQRLFYASVCNDEDGNDPEAKQRNRFVLMCTYLPVHEVPTVQNAINNLADQSRSERSASLSEIANNFDSGVIKGAIDAHTALNRLKSRGIDAEQLKTLMFHR